MRSKLAEDRGSISIEVVILAPALIICLGVLLFAGRVGMAGTAVTDIADSAARAASIERTPGTAKSAGQTEGAQALSNASVDCESFGVNVDTSDFTTSLGANGSVKATVTCSVRLSDLSGVPGVPGTKTITRTGLSPIDPWRQRR